MPAMVAAPHGRLYVREASGRHAYLRWACVWLTQLVYFGFPWLGWNGRPLLLLDLAAQRFHVFGAVLLPHDLVLLALFMVACACALFLASALAGRVWCGFGCPHTVYAAIFMRIERLVEGGSGARMRLDRGPPSWHKLARKALKHGLWVLAALAIGLTLAAYFTPAPVLIDELLRFELGPWQLGLAGSYGLLAYVNAGWMRSEFCHYICPHQRFQSVMQDRATLQIRYDAQRGEPRALRNRKNAAAARRGSCVDCTICVQVCPTGIDIRDGLQYDCMGCAACIDACDAVMDKIGEPRGLIGYTAPGHGRRARLLRPRVLACGAALAASVAAIAGVAAARQPVRLSVAQDRTFAPRALEDGMVENVYRLHVMNTGRGARRLRIGVAGAAKVEPAEVVLEEGASRLLGVRVTAAAEGNHPLVFALSDRDLRLREVAAHARK